MGDFDERVQKLIKNPGSFDEDEVDELFDIADGDSERMITLWCAIPKDEQLYYSAYFKDVAKSCENDLNKKIQVWSNTGTRVKKRNEDFLKSIMDDVYNIDNHPSSQMLDFLMTKLPESYMKEERFGKALMRITDYFINDNPSVDNMITLCRHRKKIEDTVKQMDELYEFPLAKVQVALKKIPSEITKAIETGKLRFIDEIIFDAIVKSNPPQSKSSMLQVLKEARYGEHGKDSSIAESPLALTAFEQINDQMKKDNDYELAPELWNIEMSVMHVHREPIGIPSKRYLNAIHDTIDRCCMATNDYHSIIASYIKNIGKIKEFIDKLPVERHSAYSSLQVVINSLLEDIKRHPDQIIETAGPENTVQYFGIESFCKGIEQIAKSGKDTSSHLKYPLNLTVEQFKTLLKIKSIPQGLKVEVTCKNASEISIQDLEEINGRFHCESIKFEDKNIGSRQKKPYTLDEYKMCRAKIDELCESVVIPAEGESNREKKIYAQVMLRLAKHMQYNHEHVDLCDKLEEEISKIEEMPQESKMDNTEKLYKLRNERKNMDMVTPRNMIGGLLQKECVCAGYAEIVRNTLACCGIEATYVQGFDVKVGHAWNQVRLDGQWYNMDLTWARDVLVETGGRCPIHLLMNDKDFASGEHRGNGLTLPLGGHKQFSNKRSEEYECSETFPFEEISELFQHSPAQGITYKDWINQAYKHINSTQVRDAERTVQGDRRSRERGQVHDKQYRDR